MPPLSLLIKPASGSCDLRCQYCFYADEMKHRNIPNYGVMSVETLEILVRRSLEEAEGMVTFGFQGGEPTLAGLEFYETFCRLVRTCNPKKLPIQIAIQTNGMRIDRQWAEFLARERFLVGLSLDGPRSVHDRCRVDVRGEGTFKRVLEAAGLLEQAGTEFNILTVLTEQGAREIGRIYNFLVSRGYLYQQYIPCLAPLDGGGDGYALRAETYGQALKELFDLWFADYRRGVKVYNRYFENLVGILAGYQPESCDMRGRCSLQYVVEADGSVYPCDFYVLDEYRMGSVVDHSFAQLASSPAAVRFLEESRAQPKQCDSCRWRSLCRGGCRRNRPWENGELGLNQFCEAYQTFYAYAGERLMSLAQSVRR